MAKHQEVINNIFENVKRHSTISLELYCYDLGPKCQPEFCNLQQVINLDPSEYSSLHLWSIYLHTLVF